MRGMDKLRMDKCYSRLGADRLLRNLCVRKGSKAPQQSCTLRYSLAYQAQGTTAGVWHCGFFPPLCFVGARCPGDRPKWQIHGLIDFKSVLC
jgi:hypothetical protein